MYIQWMVGNHVWKAVDCIMRASKVGQLDELKFSVSKSCEAADPSTQMGGCQIQLKTPKTESVPHD